MKSDWRMRNEYTPTNDDSFTKRRFKLLFSPKDPDVGIALLHRPHRLRLRVRLRQDLLHWWRATRWRFDLLDRLFFDAFGVCGVSAAKFNRPLRAKLYFWLSEKFRY